MREEAGRSAGTPAAWRALCDELDRWGDSGRVASLWWRDDDAAAPTAELDRLLALAGAVPLALAVIPAKVEPSLAAVLSQAPQVAVLQHGWSHTNHGGAGKKSEFPEGRSPAAVAAELSAGQDRLADLFGEQALPILAPPWNRFAAAFLPLLAQAGMTGLSRQGARPAASPAAGVAEVNVHADLVDWHGGRGFVGSEAALAAVTLHLSARRDARVDSAEPTGILTHHLVQDRATDAFLADFLSLTRRHPAAQWLDAATVFGSA